MSTPGVTVALPVYRDSGTLRQAVNCLTSQTLTNLDIVIVLNGSDERTRAAAFDLARGDQRCRILELPEPNLAAACNVALEAARFDLVARMDADDLCPPQRLEIQARHMQSHPQLAGLGSAWELLGSDDQVIATVRPPCEPATLRWRLLLGNTLAHGSMMLRRESVLRAGGYNTRCNRAQDYELWLRLGAARSLGCVPEVLYQHRTRFTGDPGRSTLEQAGIAGPLMLDAWRKLPLAEGAPSESLRQAVVAAIAREPGGGCDEIERVLETSLSRDALLTWLWAQWFHPPAPRRAMDVCKRARIREIGIQLRADGVDTVWLWGAGDHTRWLLQLEEELGLRINGIVDDHRAGEVRFGHTVRSPGLLQAGEAALISSDWYEDAIWESAAPARARGVRVFRIYA